MKKIGIIASLILTMAAGSAQAVFSIQWNVSRLTTDGSAANPWLSNGQTVEAQLLQIIGVIDTGVFEGGVTDGDDVVVDMRSFTSTGTVPDNLGFFSGTWDDLVPFNAVNNQFYVRVFAPGGPVLGSPFIQSLAQTAADINRGSVPPQTPQSINFFSTFTGPSGTVMAIPEPSSLALIALGTLGLMYRRHRRG